MALQVTLSPPCYHPRHGGVYWRVSIKVFDSGTQVPYELQSRTLPHTEPVHLAGTHATCLRARYAKSGTDMVCLFLHSIEYVMMSGTDIAYGSQRGVRY
eukprot:3941893-Rhodomonas_salina.1